MAEKLTAGQLQIGDKFTIDTSGGNHQAQVVKVDEGGIYYAPPASGEAHQFSMPDGTIAGRAGSPLNSDIIHEGGTPVKGIASQRIVTRP